MEVNDQILSLIQIQGPSLPTVIAKHISKESYFASAHLSELKDLGKIKISNLKIGGGSPLYFLPGQESQLQNFSDNLGEKEKQVYDLLKQKRILQDSELVPVFRAAIRTIKDFAFPFNATIKGDKQLFWKWYLTSHKEAEELLRTKLGIKKVEKTPEKIESKLEEKPIEKNEQQQKLESSKKPITNDAEFYAQISSYFNKSKIIVVEETIIRKKSDIEFIIEIPSPLGNLRYFVKAKSKKKINDGDLSSVFIQAQTKRLPALFLSKGSLTKKAQEMLENEFKGMKFQNF